jgi:lipopolysaccharide assembly protein A
MKIIRSVLWVVIIVALALFTAFNWTSVDIRIWESLVLETKLPVLILVAFLLGFGPMWLTHRTTVWRLKRRIGSLEASQRSLIASQNAPTPNATAPNAMSSNSPGRHEPVTGGTGIDTLGREDDRL